MPPTVHKTQYMFTSEKEEKNLCRLYEQTPKIVHCRARSNMFLGRLLVFLTTLLYYNVQVCM